MHFNTGRHKISLGGSSVTKTRDVLLEQARQERFQKQQWKRENDAARVIGKAFRSHVLRKRWKQELRQEWDDTVKENTAAWNDGKMLLFLMRMLLQFFGAKMSKRFVCAKNSEDWNRLSVLSKLLYVNSAKKNDTTGGRSLLSNVDGHDDQSEPEEVHANARDVIRLVSLWCAYIGQQYRENLLYDINTDRDSILFVKMFVLCLDQKIYAKDSIYLQVCTAVSDELFHCLAMIVNDLRKRQETSPSSRQLMQIVYRTISLLLVQDVPSTGLVQSDQWRKMSTIVGYAFVSSFLTDRAIDVDALEDNDKKLYQHGLYESSALAKIVLGSKMCISKPFTSHQQASFLLLNLVNVIKFHLEQPESRDIFSHEHIFKEYLETVSSILQQLVSVYHRESSASMDIDDGEDTADILEFSREHIAANAVQFMMADRKHARSLFNFVRAKYMEAKRDSQERQSATLNNAFGGFGGFGGSQPSVMQVDTTLHSITPFAKLYRNLLNIGKNNDFLRGQLLGTLTYGLGLSPDGFLGLLFDSIFTNYDNGMSQNLDVDLPMLDMFSQCYTHVLAVLDDQEFHQKQVPFTHEQNTQIALVTKEICFDLYWNQDAQNVQGLDTSSVRSLRENLTILLKHLHSRDSRKRFTPAHFIDADGQNEFWWAKQTIYWDYTTLRVDNWRDDDLDNDGNRSSPAMDDIDMVSRYSLGQRRMMSLQRGMRSEHFIRPTKIASQKHEALRHILRSIPFVIPFSHRVGILHRFIQQDKEQLSQSYIPFSPPINIRRRNVFDDAFSKLQYMSGLEMKKQINVQFLADTDIQEEGIGVGVFKEFLTELCKQAFSPNYGLFVTTTSGNTESGLSVYPNPHSNLVSDDHLAMFEFLGKVLGKALFENLIVDVPFARFFLSKLLGNKNFFNDLPSLDLELYRNLMFLKNYEGNVENDLSLNFTVADDHYGHTVVQSMIKNGQSVAVTNENRLEYILRVANYRLNTQIHQQSNAFLKGLRQIIPQQWLRMFGEDELFLLICGREDDIDIMDWRRHTTYSGGYNEKHLTIQLFWDVVMNDLSQQQRGLLLKFITSSRRPPLLGFKELYPPVTIKMTSDRSDLSRLPSSSTCINLLKLAPYSRRQDLKDKLILAIEETQGFELT